MSGPERERSEFQYVSEAERLPIAQGIFVLVGQPFEREIGRVKHADGEEFGLTQKRIKLSVIAFDETLGETTSYSFTKFRAEAGHLIMATQEETELARDLMGQELFQSYGELYQKSSIQMLFPLQEIREYKRIRKLIQLINTPGRFRLNKAGVKRNQAELEEMISKITKRGAMVREREEMTVDDGVVF